jgi:hypothetical protein
MVRSVVVGPTATHRCGREQETVDRRPPGARRIDRHAVPFQTSVTATGPFAAGRVATMTQLDGLPHEMPGAGKPSTMGSGAAD